MCTLTAEMKGWMNVNAVSICHVDYSDQCEIYAENKQPFNLMY